MTADSRQDTLPVSPASIPITDAEVFFTPSVMKQIFETTQQGFWFIGPDGKTFDVNPAMCVLLGRDHSDIVGRSVFDFVDDKNASILKREIEARRMGKKGSYELSLQLPDGTNRPCINNAISILDDNSTFQGSVGIWTDISENKRIEKALEDNKATLERRVAERTAELAEQNELVLESERNYRSLFDNALIGIGRTRIDNGRLLLSNKRLAVLFGYDDVDTFVATFKISENFADPKKREEIFNISRNDPRHIHEVAYKRRDGSIFHASVEIQINDDEGYLDFAFADISDRVAIEADARYKENLVDTIIRDSPVSISIKDMDGRLILASDLFLNQLGSSAEDLTGKTLKDVLTPEVFAESRRAELQVLKTGKPLAADQTFAANIGNTSLLVTKFPIKNEFGDTTQIATIALDITKQKKIEEELHQAKLSAENANRSKSAFLASMSHELRTPLNAIIGFSEIISEQMLGPIDLKYLEYAQDIHRSGTHLLDLVRDLLDLSAIETGARELILDEFGIAALTNECTRTIKMKAVEKRQNLQSFIAPNCPPLVQDRRGIKQILLNILTNAVKFTPNEGKISLTATCTESEAIFSVKDTGCGVSEDKIPKMADPWLQLGENFTDANEGWGLGLAIVKSLLDHMEGSWEIESQLNIGTTVTVRVPNRLTLNNDPELTKSTNVLSFDTTKS